MTPEELKKALKQCVHCGRCQAVCPVYKRTLREGSVARGKLSLLSAELNHTANLGHRMKDLLSHCLLCGACAEGCAGGVEADELIRAGRSLALKEGGLDGMRSLLTRDLLSRGPAMKTLWKTRSLFLKNVPGESGLHFRFPLPGLDRRRWLPRLADTPFLNQSATVYNPNGAGPRVALFVGCVANFLRPESARAAVRLLCSADARVTVPPAQVCCGKPAAGAGDEKTALFTAERNMAAFKDPDCDYIATFCATCSDQLKHYRHIPGLAHGGSLADRVMDFNDLLWNVLKWKPETTAARPSEEPLRVFYHDPCHLRRKQGIVDEPRQLIRSLPGVELTGGDQPPVCCGYGGIFNLWHYDLSLDLFRERARTILPLSPDVAATTCSGCWLQFMDGAHQMDHPFQVRPLVELLAERGLKETP